MRVWSRVYFYAIIGAAACLAFLASPGKPWLQRKLKTYQSQGKKEGDRPPVGRRAYSVESYTRGGPGQGLPDDMGAELDEIVEEVKREIVNRRRRGSKVELPTGEDLKKVVQEKLREKGIDLG